MWRFNTAVGDITLDVDDKGGHHSVFAHIPVQKQKYYINHDNRLIETIHLLQSLITSIILANFTLV